MQKILPIINSFLDKRINLRRGERKKIFLLQANIFIIISVLLILKPVFTSMMISYHGIDILPFAYMGIAISAIVVQTIANLNLGKRNLIHRIFTNHFFQITLLTLISIAIYSGFLNAWFSFALYLYISIFALVTVTYFYQYCQMLLTIRDAKRVYAYIGSGAIAGGVFGGYFTSIMVPHVGNAGLVSTAAVLMVFSAFILRILHKSYKEDGENTLVIPQEQSTLKKEITIFNNRHVINVALIIGLGVLASKLVDYQFNYLAQANIPDENQLTSFFGFWFSTINVLGLCIQMFFVSKIIDRMGVSKSMAIMPLLLILGGILVLIFPILAIGVLLKLFEGSLKQSVYKTSTEINFMPLTTNLRNRAKTFIDVVVDSAATGIAGIFIFFVINKAELPFSIIGILTLVILTLWLIVIYQSRKTYKKELTSTVQASHSSYNITERIGSNFKKISLDQYLRDQKVKPRELRNTLHKLTFHDNANLRKAAILRYIKEYGYEAVENIDHCQRDPKIDVRKVVYFALMMISKNEEEVDNIFKYLDNSDFIIAVAALAEAIGNNTKQKRIYQLNRRIDKAYERLTFEPPKKNLIDHFGQVYRAIAVSKYITRYPILVDAITNRTNNALQKEALKAIAYGRSVKLFHVLKIKDIDESNLNTFYKTLAAFPFRLLRRIKDLKEKDAAKLNQYLPSLKFVDDQQHLDFLFTLLDDEHIKTRRLALRIINACQKRFPHLSYNKKGNERRLRREIKRLKDLSAAMAYIQKGRSGNHQKPNHSLSGKLETAILEQINKTILSIFIYMSLLIDEDELSMIYHALKSTRKNAALDLLDGILHYKYRKLLLPIMDLVINERYTETNIKEIKHSVMNRRRMKRLLRNLKNKNLNKLYQHFLVEQKTILEPV